MCDNPDMCTGTCHACEAALGVGRDGPTPDELDELDAAVKVLRTHAADSCTHAVVEMHHVRTALASVEREAARLRAEQAESWAFAPAKAVFDAAKEIVDFRHIGSDSSDMLWDVLCGEVRDAVNAWEKACRGGSDQAPKPERNGAPDWWRTHCEAGWDRAEALAREVLAVRETLRALSR